MVFWSLVRVGEATDGVVLELRFVSAVVLGRGCTSPPAAESRGAPPPGAPRPLSRPNTIHAVNMQLS